MPPTLTNGKICYIEMPAADIARSADFYKRVFGWHIRQRGDGSTAFDDTTGQVSGTWVLGRSPASNPGLMVYIMVDSVSATLDVILANGGEIVQPIGAGSPEITGMIRVLCEQQVYSVFEWDLAHKAERVLGSAGNPD